MFNKLLKMFHDGIIIMEEGEITYQNEKVQKIFKLQSQDMVTTAITERNNLIEQPERSSLHTALMNCSPKVKIQANDAEKNF